MARLHNTLKQVVLDDVANGAGLIVKAAAPFDAEILRHGDLHAFDIVAIPERLHERVGKAEDNNVIHRPFPQVMVDAKNRGLGENSMQNAVQLLRRRQVVAERLLHDDAGAPSAAQPDLASCSTTVSNRSGGIAR